MRLFAIFLLGVAGCSKSPSLGDSGGSTLNPACDDGAPPDTYVAGLSHKTVDGAFNVAIEDALPAPSDVGANTYKVRVDAPAGSAVRLRPWMPLHGHGTTLEWWTGAESAGVWTFDDVNLHMAGLWELRFTVDSDDYQNGALFRFCLEG